MTYSNPSPILPDVQAFLARVQDSSPAGYQRFFDGDGPVFIARAPGRLDVMGGIADYSGATVWELPAAEAAVVGWQWRTDDQLRVRTSSADSDIVHEVTGRLGELFEGNMPVNYATARARLTASKTQTWAAYILGSPVAVARELNTPFERGA